MSEYLLMLLSLILVYVILNSHLMGTPRDWSVEVVETAWYHSLITGLSVALHEITIPIAQLIYQQRCVRVHSNECV